MRRTYCDGCGVEIDRNYVSERYRPKLMFNGQWFMAEVMIHKGKTVNTGELCKECLLKIINEGKE